MIKVKVFAVQSVQLCVPIDCSPPGSSVHGIIQATMKWVAHPSPGDIPNPGIAPGSPALQADSLPSEPPGKPCEGNRQEGQGSPNGGNRLQVSD